MRGNVTARAATHMTLMLDCEITVEVQHKRYSDYSMVLSIRTIIRAGLTWGRGEKVTPGSEF